MLGMLGFSSMGLSIGGAAWQNSSPPKTFQSKDSVLHHIGERPRIESIKFPDNDKMAAGGAKGGIAHRSKPAPKKAEAKTLKRKRGQEDLGKLQEAVKQLVGARLSCRPASPSIVP